MVSDAKKAAKDAKKAARAAKGLGSKKKSAADLEDAEETIEIGSGHVPNDPKANDVMRCVTGVLSSRPTSRDIKIDGFSMGLNGVELIQDCSIEVTIGRRYGLLGQNGSGKTNFLCALANREVPLPDHLDLYHLFEEAAPSDKDAVESVVDYIKEEIKKLEELEEEIMSTVGPEDERLELIYTRLEELDPTTFEAKAYQLLHGLGFSKAMMARATKDMSGGWRMRVALARALFVRPTLLLLDEPTNHLDLEACVWLEEYLKTYDKCLIIISHSQDFLNGVCTHIIWLTQGRLTYYTGNYDTYLKTVAENEVIQQKKYEKEQEDIKHIKQFIASCGTFSNLVRQAKSKQKILDKMYAAGLTPPVTKEKHFRFSFPHCDKLPPPVLPFVDVSFAYSGKKEDYLYTGLEFGIDCDSRIALVGPNGAGKSTLLKLMEQEIVPTEGDIRRNPHLRIGRYNQHSEDVLDLSKNPLDFMRDLFPEGIVTADGFRKMDITDWRGKLGIFGVTGDKQTLPMKTMSPGFRARVVFCLMSLRNPHMLLLDEPTNPLDMDMIDSLALAIKKFSGGVVLVSHDFRLLEQVADSIWVCDHKAITPWGGDIQSYKTKLRKDQEAQSKKMFTGSGVQ